MTLRIHNTLTRALEPFSPLEPGHVRMYVCGMTVYDLCHLGHARSMVAFDVVQRWLKASGLRVTYVRNVTDIDDKIIKRALENGETIRALTDRMVDALRQEKFERAEVLVDKFMAVNPRDPQMRFWKAWITDRTGDKQVALDLYLSLTQDYPEIAEPFNNLAVLYAAKGQFSVAKEALDAALRANPNYADAHENMGDVLVQLANYSYKRSLQINPTQRGVSRKINILKPSLEINQVKP